MLFSHKFDSETHLKNELRKEFRRRGLSYRERRQVVQEALGYTPAFRIKDMKGYEVDEVLRYLRYNDNWNNDPFEEFKPDKNRRQRNIKNRVNSEKAYRKRTMINNQKDTNNNNNERKKKFKKRRVTL